MTTDTWLRADTPASRPSGSVTPGWDHPIAQLVRRQSITRNDEPYLEGARDARRLSFDDLGSAVSRWGALLDEVGVPTGATVAITLADPIDFCAAFLGTLASGRWAAPLDPAVPVTTLHAALARTSADVLVSADPPAVTERVTVVRCAPGTFGTSSWKDLVVLEAPCIGGAGMAALEHDAGARGGRLGGVLLSSSGTTGEPKLIALHVPQLLHTAGAVAEHHRLEPGERGFNPLPLFHINAEVVAVLASLVAGSCVVLDDRFHREGFWDLVTTRRITWLNAVPAVLARLGELREGEVVPSGIRFARSASAALPAPTRVRFEERTGITVLETYGMTEAASQIAANPLDGPRKAGSVGRPVGIDLRVVLDADDGPASDRTAPTGQVGEVRIKGPSVSVLDADGFASGRLDDEGWLPTGDLGYLDDDGYLTLVGRRDDVINRGGEKMLPTEIEEALLEVRSVTAAAVVPEPDDVFGQVPAAYLVLDPRIAADEVPSVLDQVRRHLEHSLVRPKRPSALYVVASLPVGPTGKVQRRALRAPDHP